MSPSSDSPAVPETLTALLHGPDQPGLVARVAGWPIYERGGNILHADQHRDEQAGIFLQRVEAAGRRSEFHSGGRPPKPAACRAEALGEGGCGGRREGDSEAFAQFASELGMSARVASSLHRSRVAIFVSKAGHCFHDLALRWKEGEFRADLAAVVSNHAALAEAARGYGIPFHHIPADAGTRAAAEARQLALLREEGIELVVLARYMQILSGEFLAGFGRPVINIHHSFLPAFAGGRPYHQAHERGVKLIGATAHYATAELDDGPIIQQDVARVTHRHGVEDLIRKGRDLEKTVLAQALRWHLESRVLVYGRKTVVFD